jgi:6-phosphogluconolactonase (cycloisomerase 2 family)
VLGRAIKTSLAVALVAGALASLGAAAASAAGTLYTNNYSEEQVAAFSIGSDGLLAPLSGSPFATPGAPQAIALTPDGRQMVLAYDFVDRLGTAALGPGGVPTPTGTPISAQDEGTPAISPDGKFVYVPHQPNGLRAFAIAPGGELTAVGGTFGSADGSFPAITPDGHFLFDPDFNGGAVQRFAIQADGSLTSLGTTPVGFKGPYALRITPDGRFAILFSLLLESGSGDLRSFAIGNDGSLTATGFVTPATSTVMGAPAISPDGRFLYAPNGNEESVTTYLIGANGALSEVGSPTPTGLPQVQGLAMSVDGRFLYAEPQSGQYIQAFSVAPDGTLTKIGAQAPTGGFSDGSTPLARPSSPVASFTVSPAPPHAPTTFDAGASTDTLGTIVSYDWDFGDGTTQTSGSPRISHVYAEAGVYTVKLGVTDDNSCTGFSYTGQSAYCGGRDATVSVDTPPAIYSLLAAPAKFSTAKTAKKPKPGTSFHYKLSEKAKVRFTIKRKKTGRKVGSFVAKGKAGKNRRRFRGKLKGRRLKPGAYVVLAVATDSAGARSTPRRANFKVVAP